MTMNQRSLRIEKLLFLAIFLLALAVRLVDLGAMPLNDREASLALQALQISRGEKPPLTGQPLYILSTGGLFFLFGNSNFIGRLLPALAGTVLILAVYLLRRQIGSNTALIFALAVALDPGFVTQSRLAGGLMLAMASLALCYYFWLNQQPVLCGVMLAFSLLGGTSFLHGAIALALAVFISRKLEQTLTPLPSGRAHPDTFNSASREAEQTPAPLPSGRAQRNIFVSALITLLLGGTLFFIVPQGLSAVAAIFTEYLSAWFKPSGTPLSWMLLALPVYHPLAVTFAAVALFRNFALKNSSAMSNGRQRFLSLWFIIAFLMSLLYPSRQMGDLLWALLPLWLLAAREMENSFFPLDQPRWIPILQACAVFILLVMFWLQVAAYSQILSTIGFNLLRLATILSTLVLIGLVVWLVSLGKSPRAAWQGLSLGLLLSLGLYSFAGTWGSAVNYPWSQVFRQEFWKSYPQIADADLLQKTIHDLSSWKVGRSDRLSITLAVDSPALRWLLRHQQNLSLIPEEAALAGFASGGNTPLPDIIITRAVAQPPSLAASYRGQDFNWQVAPIWQSGIPADPLGWLLFRRASWQPETIILWVRSDVFPSGMELPASQSAPLPDDQLEENPAQ